MEFLAKGKDGYDAFLEGRVIKDGELLPTLPSLVRNHLRLKSIAEMMLDETAKTKHWGRKWKRLSLVEPQEKSDATAAARRESAPPGATKAAMIAPVKENRI